MNGADARAIIADANSEDAVRALEIAQDFFGTEDTRIHIDGTMIVRREGCRCLLKAQMLCKFATYLQWRLKGDMK